MNNSYMKLRAIISLLLTFSAGCFLLQEAVFGTEIQIRSISGTDPRETIDQAWKLSNRGLSFESVIILKQVPDNWKPTSSQGDPSYLEDLRRAGDLAFLRSELDSAEKFYKESRVVAKTNRGEKSPEYVLATIRLALLYATKQETKHTEELIAQAAALLDDAFTEPGLDKFRALCELAVGHSVSGKKNLATDIYVKAFDMAQKSAANPIEYARAILELGPYWVYTLEPAQAEKTLQEVQNIFKESIGENTGEYVKVLRTAAIQVRAYAASSEIQELYKLGKYQEAQSLIEKKNIRALELLEKAAQIHESLTPQQAGEYIEVLKDLSIAYYSGTDQSKKNKAKELIEKGILISQNVYQEKDPSLLAWMSNLQGADFSARISLLTEAETIAKRVYGDRNQYYSSMVQQLAGAYFGRYNTAHSEADKQEALRLYESWSEITKNIYGEKSQSYVQALNILASTYQQFDKQKAIALMKQAEFISNSNKSEGPSSLSNRTLSAENYIRLERNYAKGAAIYEEVLKEGKGAWGEHSEGQYWSSMGRLASLYVEMGEYDKALKLYDQIKESIPENQLWLNWIVPVANILTKLGEYERAENLLKPLLEEVTTESAMSQSMIQGILGNIYMLTERYREAAKCYEEPLEALKKAFPGLDVDAISNFGSDKLFSLAIAKHHMGERDKAEVLMTRALTKGISPQYKVGAAEFYYLGGDLQKAEQLLADALVDIQKNFEQLHPDNAAALTQAALQYETMGNHDKSLENQLLALASLEEFVSRLALWASEERLQTYLGTVEQRNDYLYSLVASHYKGETNETSQIFEMHLSYKGKLVEKVSLRNRLALLSKNPALLKTIEELRDVTQQISHLSLQPPKDMKTDQFKEFISKLEEKRSGLEEALARGVAEFSSQRSVTSVKIEELAASLPSGGVYLDFVEYRRYDYQARKWTDERRYLAFMLTRDNTGKPAVRIEDVGSTDSINPLIEKFRVELQREGSRIRGIGGKRPAESSASAESYSNLLTEIGSSLYEKLLKPFDNEISGASSLIISPSGNLNLIPFEVLNEHTKLGYINDRLTISYSLGRDIVVAKHGSQTAAEKTNTQLAVVAAPDFAFDKSPEKVELSAVKGASESMDATVLSRGIIRGWPITFPELPGTLKEANAIQKIATDGTIQMFIKDRALEENVKKLQHPQVLHIATHGFFLEDVERLPENTSLRGVGGIRPTETAIQAQKETKLAKSVELRNPLLRSGLALAGANRLADNIPLPEGADDGILTAAEVTSLDLYGTDLVVLSACETGLGEVHRGEGVSGLRRAFRIAGARNIIMSLWSVPDEETAWLMESFYKHYLRGEKASVALNKARAVLRDRLIERDGFAHPYYWAAFILEGSDI